MSDRASVTEYDKTKVKRKRIDLKRGVLQPVNSGTIDNLIVTKKGVIYMKK